MKVLPIPSTFAISHPDYNEDTPSKSKLLKRKEIEINNKTNEIPEYAKWSAKLLRTTPLDQNE
jgi:hypothetical protein